MAKTIIIKEETETSTEMVNLLRHISNQIEEGYTNGYYPTWQLVSIVEQKNNNSNE